MLSAADSIGIVLAAGAGTRYGYPKALAENGAWVCKAVAALESCASVLVVLGATGPAPLPLGLPASARQIWAPDWGRGVSAALRSGLAAAWPTGAEYAVIMPVDTPDVGADVVDRVLTVGRTAPSGLVRAVFDGAPGHPVVAARAHWLPMSAVAAGDRGGRRYLNGRADTALIECGDLATGFDHDHRV
ncbi:NTP transferase domain-containing protein [Nocardia sp. NPDC127579]|uniref:nucleotidyltransferase family protein n=1 Tax=Nocardia sp. NPDC127579 TaxID=3345402 RepID=UPI00362AE70C